MSTMLTPEFRMSYPHLFTPQVNKRTDGTTVNEFSVVAIFALNADLSKLKKAAEALLVEKFGADKSTWPANIRSPFRKCKEKWKNDGGKITVPAGYEEGEATFMTLKQDASKGKPTVVDAMVVEIIEPHHVYAGAYARASVRPYFYNNRGNIGIGFGLSNVQKLRDGEPLGAGRAKASDEFEAVAEDMATQTAGSIFG